MLIQKLTASHNRAEFDCGVESLNLYLKQYARQNASRNLGVTYVAVSGPDSSRVEGYYTLSAGSLPFQNVPEERLPQYPIPVVLLARLAVDARNQGRGLGRELLLDSLRRVEAVSQQIGAFAVEVDALDERARAFYETFGFTSLADDRLHLYLTVKVIRKLLAAG